MYKTILEEKNPKVKELLINVFSQKLKWEVIETKIKKANKKSFINALKISAKLTGYNSIDNYNYVRSITGDKS